MTSGVQVILMAKLHLLTARMEKDQLLAASLILAFLPLRFLK
jgi:hypothetical protein